MGVRRACSTTSNRTSTFQRRRSASSSPPAVSSPMRPTADARTPRYDRIASTLPHDPPAWRRSRVVFLSRALRMLSRARKKRTDFDAHALQFIVDLFKPSRFTRPNDWQPHEFLVALKTECVKKIRLTVFSSCDPRIKYGILDDSDVWIRKYLLIRQSDQVR